MKRLGGGYRVTALIMDFVFLLALLFYGAALFYVLYMIISTEGMYLVGEDLAMKDRQYGFLVVGTVVSVVILFVILIVFILGCILLTQDMQVLSMTDDRQATLTFKSTSLMRGIASLIICYFSNMISSPAVIPFTFIVIFIVSVAFAIKAMRLLK